MRRASSLLAVLLLFVSVLVGQLTPGVSAQSLPAGVPDGAERATVTGHVDGDKLKVSVNREGETVLLAGIDAPEPGECFAKESADRVEDLLPEGTRVYLLRSGDDRDGKDRLLRYVWVPQEGKDAYLLNTKLVRDGFAGFDDRHDNPRYFERLDELQGEARDADRGVWGACKRLHAAAPAVARAVPTEVPVAVNTSAGAEQPDAPAADSAGGVEIVEAAIADCGAFASFDAANAYYAGRPDAQPFLDPNWDGRACEDWFGVDAAVAAVAPAPSQEQGIVADPGTVGSGGGGGCPYVNVDGNVVPCPVESPSAPAGATAQCNDGTWSFSQNRQGTCSGHGGVAYWL